jgi:hypothetical protein
VAVDQAAALSIAQFICQRAIVFGILFELSSVQIDLRFDSPHGVLVKIDKGQASVSPVSHSLILFSKAQIENA